MGRAINLPLQLSMVAAIMPSAGILLCFVQSDEELLLLEAVDIYGEPAFSGFEGTKTG